MLFFLCWVLFRSLAFSLISGLRTMLSGGVVLWRWLVMMVLLLLLVAVQTVCRMSTMMFVMAQRYAWHCNHSTHYLLASRDHNDDDTNNQQPGHRMESDKLDCYGALSVCACAKPRHVAHAPHSIKNALSYGTQARKHERISCMIVAQMNLLSIWFALVRARRMDWRVCALCTQLLKIFRLLLFLCLLLCPRTLWSVGEITKNLPAR